MIKNDYNSEITEAELVLSSGKVLHAISLFEKLANLDSQEALDWLVLIYSDDSYGVVDYGKSIEWANKSIERFDSNIAKLVLATIYFYGDGVEVDYEKSFTLYNRIPEGMFSQREYSLALMYYYGKAVKQNYASSLTHAKESYRLGNIGARQLISQIYTRNHNWFFAVYYKIAFILEQTMFKIRGESIRENSLKHTLL